MRFARIVSLGLILAVSVWLSSPANAKAKKYKNCAALTKVYQGGVSKPGAVNSGGTITRTPTVNKSVYTKNKGLDRDKDGIACEN